MARCIVMMLMMSRMNIGLTLVQLTLNRLTLARAIHELRPAAVEGQHETRRQQPTCHDERQEQQDDE